MNPFRIKMTKPQVWLAGGTWLMGFGGIVTDGGSCSELQLTLLFALFHPQNTPVGTPIFIVNATDPDLGAGGSVLYSFQPPSQFFAIDSARGIVTVIRELDYETTQAYQLTVNATVSPSAGGPGSQVSASSFTRRGRRLPASFPARQGL